ncbi:MAG: DUF817 domain-containing protein [bacterium]|nr:DUF817 domain-containing protein [bacterium]
MERSTVRTAFHILLTQLSASIFGVALLAAILATRYWYPLTWMHRCDFLLFYALCIQAAMLLFKLESWREALVILLFHVLAMGMEYFKTSEAIHSWQYPEPFVMGVGNVPLFVGFMYGAVASYLVRARKLLRVRLLRYPRRLPAFLLAALIYVNFFTHHFVPDFRVLLLVGSVVLFGRCKVSVTICQRCLTIPLILVWLVVAGQIWIGENVGTYAGVWLYPFQTDGWRMVPLEKLTAWYLLMIVSFVLVGLAPERDEETADSSEAAAEVL